MLCSMLNPIVTLVSELKVFCLTFSNLCSMIIVLILLTDVSIVLKMLQFCQVVFGREFLSSGPLVLDLDLSGPTLWEAGRFNFIFFSSRS